MLEWGNRERTIGIRRSIAVLWILIESDKIIYFFLYIINNYHFGFITNAFECVCARAHNHSIELSKSNTHSFFCSFAPLSFVHNNNNDILFFLHNENICWKGNKLHNVEILIGHRLVHIRRFVNVRIRNGKEPERVYGHVFESNSFQNCVSPSWTLKINIVFDLIELLYDEPRV